MKKYYLLIIFLSFLLVSHVSLGQPNLVATLTNGGPANGGAVLRIQAPTMTTSSLHSFDHLTPNFPAGGVIAGDANWLYGTTLAGGANNIGALYRIRRDGTLFSTVFQCSSNNWARTNPFYHTDGIVYFGEGTSIDKYNTSNGFTSSIPAYGNLESRNIYVDANDWIYFVAQNFPSQLIRMRTDGSNWTVLHTFNTATEGDWGRAGVTEIPGDSLFGVQTSGGLNGGGTIYSVFKDGSGFVVHHQFTAATGITPESKLVYFDGKLFGTTTQGGDHDKGVLFCINSDGSDYRVLRHFDDGIGMWSQTPGGNISITSNGRIFGAFRDFYQAPSFSNYYLYKIDTSGKNFEPFFIGSNVNIQRFNGEYGQDPLLLNDDEIFLITSQFGRNDGGVLNHVDTSGSGNDIFHFGNSPNGFRPNGGVIRASDGKLYGTTTIGGVDGNGVVYSMNVDGTGYVRLHQFIDIEGYNPSGKLFEASDGKLYGACRDGGTNGLGCIFRLNKNGTGFQVIYDYTTYTGAYSPVGGLVEDGGVLYGVNFWPYGSIFKINKDGSNYTEIKVFTPPGDLQFPYNGVKVGRNYLYGACGYGGAANKGGIFRMKKDGSSFEVLHEFDGTTDGELPVGAPLIARNGKIYGSTGYGGADGYGLLFRMDTTGSNFTILRQLSTSDGNYPWTDMIQASDSLIYGGTSTGGANNGGTLFRMNLDGSGFTVIKDFNSNTEGQGVISLTDLNGVFVLPVELISFDAEKKGQSVLLTWKTASEQNSNRFEVERSNNGTTFKLIGTVASAGNTTTTKNYSLTDNVPLTGVNYYRLKQIDIDGSFKYSKVASVNFERPKQVIVFPNPVSDRLFISLPERSNFSSVRIMDATGKLVLQKDISSSAIELDVRSLPKGWYVIQLTGDDKVEKAFIKE